MTLEAIVIVIVAILLFGCIGYFCFLRKTAKVKNKVNRTKKRKHGNGISLNDSLELTDQDKIELDELERGHSHRRFYTSSPNQTSRSQHETSLIEFPRNENNTSLNSNDISILNASNFPRREDSINNDAYYWTKLAYLACKYSIRLELEGRDIALSQVDSQISIRYRLFDSKSQKTKSTTIYNLQRENVNFFNQTIETIQAQFAHISFGDASFNDSFNKTIESTSIKKAKKLNQSLNQQSSLGTSVDGTFNGINDLDPIEMELDGFKMTKNEIEDLLATSRNPNIKTTIQSKNLSLSKDNIGLSSPTYQQISGIIGNFLKPSEQIIAFLNSKYFTVVDSEQNGRTTLAYALLNPKNLIPYRKDIKLRSVVKDVYGHKWSRIVIDGHENYDVSHIIANSDLRGSEEEVQSTGLSTNIVAFLSIFNRYVFFGAELFIQKLGKEHDFFIKFVKFIYNDEETVTLGHTLEDAKVMQIPSKIYIGALYFDYTTYNAFGEIESTKLTESVIFRFDHKVIEKEEISSCVVTLNEQEWSAFFPGLNYFEKQLTMNVVESLDEWKHMLKRLTLFKICEPIYSRTLKYEISLLYNYYGTKQIQDLLTDISVYGQKLPRLYRSFFHNARTDQAFLKASAERRPHGLAKIKKDYPEIYKKFKTSLMQFIIDSPIQKEFANYLQHAQIIWLEVITGTQLANNKCYKSDFIYIGNVALVVEEIKSGNPEIAMKMPLLQDGFNTETLKSEALDLMLLFKFSQEDVTKFISNYSLAIPIDRTTLSLWINAKAEIKKWAEKTPVGMDKIRLDYSDVYEEFRSKLAFCVNKQKKLRGLVFYLPKAQEIWSKVTNGKRLNVLGSNTEAFIWMGNLGSTVIDAYITGLIDAAKFPFENAIRVHEVANSQRKEASAITIFKTHDETVAWSAGLLINGIPQKGISKSLVRTSASNDLVITNQLKSKPEELFIIKQQFPVFYNYFKNALANKINSKRQRDGLESWLADGKQLWVESVHEHNLELPILFSDKSLFFDIGKLAIFMAELVIENRVSLKKCPKYKKQLRLGYSDVPRTNFNHFNIVNFS